MQKRYYFRDWDEADYLQEGRLILQNMIEAGCTHAQLRAHFKVKYKHRMIDVIRRRSAQKREHEKNAYEVIDDYTEVLQDFSSNPEDELIYSELVKDVFTQINQSYGRLLTKQLETQKLTRMERSRLKKEIKKIIYPDDLGNA